MLRVRAELARMMIRMRFLTVTSAFAVLMGCGLWMLRCFLRFPGTTLRYPSI